MGTITATVERAAHLIGAYMEPMAAELGITQGEAHVLAQIDQRGITSIAILHREFGHKRSTLTNILDRLEDRKLVRRELNRSDRRSWVVHLTAAGRRTASRVSDKLGELEHEIDALIGEGDVAGLDAVILALEAVVRRQPR